ncbi:uncharacterized protein LOC130764532 isoform X1 [Actinidia eriantha]|uniref:uncharacterized protein LOC130764532 isoform X1 n=1 Tax=Actinidia eriantha TaxID=165200 RepID=UPI00258F5E70|nr:uncharacterized protein LOC130764532 isoform X1 [Actinidia eriantha]
MDPRIVTVLPTNTVMAIKMVEHRLGFTIVTVNKPRGNLIFTSELARQLAQLEQMREALVNWDDEELPEPPEKMEHLIKSHSWQDAIVESTNSAAKRFCFSSPAIYLVLLPTCLRPVSICSIQQARIMEY